MISKNILYYLGINFGIISLLFTVSTDMENKAAWKECFSVRGIRLPTGYYFGITAATGDLSDIHDVLSVRLYELDAPNDVSKIN